MRLYAGIAWMVVAALAAASSSLFIKLSTNEIGFTPILFYQYAIGGIFLAPFFLIKPTERVLWRAPVLHFFRLGAGLGAIGFTILAVRTISLTDYFLLFNTGPLWVPLLVWLFFKQKPSFGVVIGLALGFIGVIIVLSPALTHFNKGTIFGLASGLCCGFVIVAIKTLSYRNSTASISLTYLGLASLVTLPFAINSLWITLPSAWLFMLGAGVSMGFVQIATIEGLKRGPIGVLGVCYFMNTIFSTIYDYFIWHEHIYWITGVGAIFILSSVTWCVVASQKQKETDETMV